MNSKYKFLIMLKDFPLFFKVFALASCLMFILSGYGFFVESFREARVFLYCGLTGLLILSLISLATSNRNLRETGVMQLISLIFLFLLLPLFLAVPTWIIVPGIAYIDAYLDMVGVLTTTGLRVFSEDLLSKSIHLWRAIVAWFGGGLILIVAFVILLPAARGGFDVFSTQKRISSFNRKLTLNERSSTLNKISKKLIPIYIALTVILWCFLTSLGTDGYTSLIRAFSILSTSGISGPYKFGSDEAGFWGELIIIVFLLLALSHNTLYYITNKTDLKKVLLNRELRFGLFSVLFVSLLLFLKELNQINSDFILHEVFINSCKLFWGNFFTALSFISTNGYISSYWSASQSSQVLPHISVILLGLCLFGGGLATTAGGIKLLRISVLFSSFSSETGKLLNPSSVIGINTTIKTLQVSVFMAWISFMLFIVSIASLIIILTIFGLLFEDAIILAVACITTTGPIIEVLGLGSWLISDLSHISKIALVAGMVLGRLEILVVLSLLSYGFRGS